jgi:hypothetical protein
VKNRDCVKLVSESNEKVHIPQYHWNLWRHSDTIPHISFPQDRRYQGHFFVTNSNTISDELRGILR